VARSAAGPSLDTSAPSVLRRFGLGSVIRGSFSRTLGDHLPVFLATAATAALAFLLIPKRNWGSSLGRQRMFWWIVALWLAGTFAAIPLLLIGLRVPAQRLVALCLPLPVLIGAGLARARSEWSRPVSRGILVVVGLAVAVLIPLYWVAWKAQRPNSAPAVTTSGTLGRILARQPAGTPLVLLVDDPRNVPSLFYVTRLASYLRDGVPPARVGDVHLFVGTPQDFVAGRPTLTGKDVRDRMATDYWDRIRAELDRPALAVAAAALDARAYGEALDVPGRVAIAPGVVALPGFTGAPRGSAEPGGPSLTSAGAGPLSPWLPLWLGTILVLALGAIGFPWVVASMPGANPRIRAGLAPAVGIAAVSLSAIAVDTLGLRLGGWGAIVALLLVVGSGLLVLAVSTRRRREPAPTDASIRKESPVPSSLKA
jgi:hypothetical protein